MERRKFLVGLGSASIGGSALLGSGAFSRVESHRDVTIQVAEDPDAYLGLSKCNTPNGSYVEIDEKGHLAIRMDEENPTIGDSPLGSGVNSDSRSWFHRVFQICNQGKEDVCVWIEDDDSWPWFDEDERRVEFYLEDDDEQSIIGEENAIKLELGQCVCIGIKTVTIGIGVDEWETLLQDLEDEIRLIADVDGDCFEQPEPFSCPIYGTSREDPTAIFQISRDPVTDAIIETQVGDIPDESSDSNYPNGVAFDNDNDVWYFAEDTGELKTMNEDGNLGIEEYGVVTPNGEPIAGAAFWNTTGEYLFIPNGGNTLMAAQISGGGTVSTREVVDLEWSSIGLGDLAIDRDEQVLYVSTTRTDESGANFFRVDLDEPTDQDEIASEADGDRTEFAIHSQIAFDNIGLLAHNAGTGDWRTVDVSDGSLSAIVATTRQYTDLAQCGEFEVE